MQSADAPKKRKSNSNTNAINEKTPKKSEKEKLVTFPKSLAGCLSALEKYANESSVPSLPFSNGSISSFPSIVVTKKPSTEPLDDWKANWPWTEAQYAKVLSRASQAPYGKGEETIVDKNVRNCKELKVDEFTIQKDWESTLAQILQEITNQLAPTFAEQGCYLEAELYKLVLYEPGSFFKPHRDTPRNERHIGSLVIIPPTTNHKGGQLVLRDHGGQGEKQFDANPNTCSWVAFFTDIEHEVLPVEKGYRCSLLYNLLRPSNIWGIPKPIITKGKAPPIAQFLQHIKKRYAKDNQLLQIGFFLHHQYPAPLIIPANLKGRDFLLYTWIQEAEFIVRLAAIEVRIGGSGSDDSGKRQSINDLQGMDIEIDEVNASVNPTKKKGRGRWPSRLLSHHSIDEDYFSSDEDKEESEDDKDELKKEFIYWVGDPKKIPEKMYQANQLEKQIEGSGNEGCSANWAYLHAAIIVTLSGNDIRPFDLKHASRPFGYWGC